MKRTHPLYYKLNKNSNPTKTGWRYIFLSNNKNLPYFFRIRDKDKVIFRGESRRTVDEALQDRNNYLFTHHVNLAKALEGNHQLDFKGTY